MFHFPGQACSRARYEVAIRFNRFQRPALSYERNRSIASALARHQKMLAPCKRRLTTRLTVLSMAPLPIGICMAMKHPESVVTFCPTCGGQMRVVMRLWASNRAFVDTG